jgi:hypothetical protein
MTFRRVARRSLWHSIFRASGQWWPSDFCADSKEYAFAELTCPFSNAAKQGHLANENRAEIFAARKELPEALSAK